MAEYAEESPTGFIGAYKACSSNLRRIRSRNIEDVSNRPTSSRETRLLIGEPRGRRRIGGKVTELERHDFVTGWPLTRKEFFSHQSVKSQCLLIKTCIKNVPAINETEYVVVGVEEGKRLEAKRHRPSKEGLNLSTGALRHLRWARAGCHHRPRRRQCIDANTAFPHFSRAPQILPQ
jgi:hypothetical protein